jgi:hypothetical protein
MLSGLKETVALMFAGDTTIELFEVHPVELLVTVTKYVSGVDTVIEPVESAVCGVFGTPGSVPKEELQVKSYNPVFVGFAVIVTLPVLQY